MIRDDKVRKYKDSNNEINVKNKKGAISYGISKE